MLDVTAIEPTAQIVIGHVILDSSIDNLHRHRLRHSVPIIITASPFRQIVIFHVIPGTADNALHRRQLLLDTSTA